ncbi:MAG: hypothetical protein ACLTDS_07180 [Bianqueaceae bacterium]
MRTTRKKHITFAQLVLGLLLGVYAFVCLMPLVLCVIVSFPATPAFSRRGLAFSLRNGHCKPGPMWALWKSAVNLHGVTIFITVVGTILA